MSRDFGNGTLERQPHVSASAAALDLVAENHVEGFVAGHAVTTIVYLVQRDRVAKQARTALRILLSRLKVAPITDASVRHALGMTCDDFEDAICMTSAQEALCNLIVTRNPRHFRGNAIPAILPEALLTAVAEESR
jgi:predicted nucleic acid-binding protein